MNTPIYTIISPICTTTNCGNPVIMGITKQINSIINDNLMKPVDNNSLFRLICGLANIYKSFKDFKTSNNTETKAKDELVGGVLSVLDTCKEHYVFPSMETIKSRYSDILGILASSFLLNGGRITDEAFSDYNYLRKRYEWEYRQTKIKDKDMVELIHTNTFADKDEANTKMCDAIRRISSNSVDILREDYRKRYSEVL